MARVGSEREGGPLLLPMVRGLLRPPPEKVLLDAFRHVLGDRLLRDAAYPRSPKRFETCF